MSFDGGFNDRKKMFSTHITGSGKKLPRDSRGHYAPTTINQDLFHLRGSLYVKGSMQRVCECHFIYNLKTDTETTILEHDHNYHLHGHNHSFHDHGNLFYRRQWAAGFIGIFIDDLEMRPR